MKFSSKGQTETLIVSYPCLSCTTDTIHNSTMKFRDFTIRAVLNVISGHTISSVSHVGYAIRFYSALSEKSIILSSSFFEFSSYLYVFLMFWKQRVLQLFPLRKRISPQGSIYISLFCSLILLKLFYLLGALLMDELHQAVAPFLHASGGINEGGFSQPPIPTPPPENSGLGLLPGAQREEDRPDPNHYASGSSQEAHQGGVAKKKLYIVLKKLFTKYCASQAVAEKYPYLKEEDFDYFARNFAISQLDIDDNKSDVEIANLSKYINNLNRMKPLLDNFFESYFNGD